MALLFIAMVCSSFGQTSWQVPLHLQVGNWSDTVYFGAHPTATDGFDQKIDSLAPPPAFNPYAVFYISQFPNYLRADFRSGDVETTWNLSTFNCAGKQIKLKWNLAVFDSAMAGHAVLQLVGYGTMAAVDSMVLNGDVDLKIKMILVSAVVQENLSSQPERMTLAVYPNPSRGRVNILFDGKYGEREVTIYDVLGRQVRTLYGDKAIVWDGRDEMGESVPTGLYFITLKLQINTITTQIQIAR